MPNWIYNKLTVTGEQAKEALDFMESEYNCFDFRNICPVPDYVFQGDSLGQLERELFGSDNWYDWQREHWGTKWNSNEAYRDGNVVTFQTAWNGVPKIIILLAVKFPKADYEYKYADEDFACNTGMLTIYNYGAFIDRKLIVPPNESYEAYEIASELIPYDDAYRWDEDKNELVLAE